MSGMEEGRCSQHGTYFTSPATGCPGCRTVTPTITGLNSPLTPPQPDTLEAALRAVPCRFCGELRPAHSPLKSDSLPDLKVCWPFEADPVTIAAAVREWARQQLPPPEGTQGPEYNRAVADVAGRLGL